MGSMYYDDSNTTLHMFNFNRMVDNSVETGDARDHYYTTQNTNKI